MMIGKIFGKSLTEQQVQTLLSEKEVSYTEGGKTIIVSPKIIQKDYQGKTYFQWEIRNS